MELEAQIKQRIGKRTAGRVRALVRGCLWLVAHAPLQWLRILGLKCAGASLGEDIVLAAGTRLYSPWKLRIGPHTNIGDQVHLDARGNLTIGSNCNISSEVAIWTAEHDIQSPTFAMTRGPVVIHDRAWVCFRSIILPGVTLGEGCVVASGAIVTKDVPPFAVVAGIPAKVVGQRNSELVYQLGNSSV